MFAFRNRVVTHGRSSSAGERGSVTLENIIIWPVVMVFMFGFFQFALWLHARDLAHGAATSAYYEARLYDGTIADAQAVGRGVLEASGGTIEGANVAVTRTVTTVTVTVTGSIALIVPGWPGSNVSETVTGPVERYVAP
jgi:Flp pilus assembly protein TadG